MQTGHSKNKMMMNRREALKQSILVIGGTVVSASLVSSMLTSCNADVAEKWIPAVLTQDQAAILTKAVDTVIPATSTPGAVQAGVPQLFDLFLKDNIFKKEERDMLMNGLASLDTEAQAKYGKPFAQISEEQAFEYLSELDKAAIASKEPMFFGAFKQFVVFAFATSELGATQHLQYQAVPGEYSGCVPLADIGVAWAV